MMATHSAVDAYIETKAEIDGLLAQIMDASDDHFGTRPDFVNWSNVGSLQHVRDRLREVAGFLEGKEPA